VSSNYQSLYAEVLMRASIKFFKDSLAELGGHGFFKESIKVA